MLALVVRGSELLQRGEEGKEWELGSMSCTTRQKDKAPRGSATHREEEQLGPSYVG